MSKNLINWKWGRILFLVFLFFLTLWLFYGCKSSESTVSSSESVEKTEVSDSLTTWKQSLFPNIKVKDSIYFYNNIEIILKKSLSEFTKKGRNHAIESNDSTFNIKYIIPERTAGLMIKEPVFGTGGMNDMVISYSKDSVVYTLSFSRKGSFKKPIKNKETGKLEIIRDVDDENFVLNSKAKFVFRKFTYEAEVVGLKKATLLVRDKHNKGTKNINHQAKGWKDE